MNRREFLKYSAVGIYGFSLPISMEEKSNSSFIEFAEKNFKINHWSRGIIPFETTKHHVELADLYDNNRFVLVKKYRMGGFTTMTLLWALYECITKPDTSVIFLTKSYCEAKHRIVDVAFELMPNKPVFIKSNAHLLKLTNNSCIRFCTPEATCGSTANILIFDEPAFMPYFERDYKAAIYCNKNGKIFMVSTPNRPEGYYYETYKKAIKGENKYVVYAPSCFEHPDYTPERVEFLKTQLGENSFKQECLAQFTPSGEACLDSFRELKNY